MPTMASSTGALQLAQQDIEAIYGPNKTVTIIHGDCNCELGTCIGSIYNLKLKKVDVYVGPPCREILNIVAELAVQYRTQILTWIPVDNRTHKATPDTEIIGTYGTYSSIARSIAVVLKQFSWREVGIISHEKKEICSGLVQTINAEFPNLDINIKRVHELDNLSDNQSYRDAITSITAQARIIILCLPLEAMRKVLQIADILGLTNGKYMFIPCRFGLSPSEGLLDTNTTSGVALPDRILSLLLQVGPFSTNQPDYQDFVQNTTNSSSGVKPDEFTPFLYDTLMLVTKIYFGGNATTKRRLYMSIQTNLKNKTYNGITGVSHVDSSGLTTHRAFHLSHYQNGRFEIVGTITDKYKELSKIKWPNDRKPGDEPRCGWDGSLCLSEDEDNTVAVAVGVTVASIFVVVAIIIVVVMYRKARFEKELLSMIWKVNNNEIRMRRQRPKLDQNNVQNNTEKPKKKLVRMETRGTLGFGSTCSIDRNILYAPVGNYKGSVVAVKSFQRRSVSLSREALRDFKALRELQHENINSFVGASLEPHNSYILTKYCAKGSLRDVLENDDIKLDSTFMMSFTMDLARGLDYLHKSPVKSHGNLKSTNCVIDSRWVLKITDFGAITTYPTEPIDPAGEDDYYFIFETGRKKINRVSLAPPELLWTAPEILRLQKRPQKGTQKGDIFSFAIIVQEILLRVLPYFYNNISTYKEIINRVANGSTPPFRPYIPPDSNVPDQAKVIIKSCWQENPELRMDMHSVLKRIIDLNGGKKTNIMDNMLQMLEKYSNNLEELVTERTEELAQEKQKTDTLLYQMLPPSVAEQLKRGEHVQPETFEDVSIFFSDIVGFTSISSESNPLEVVDLLNDLYTTFDSIIEKHDVYKVETIGDAYMCVSGLPRRNGKRHCGEIANMALDLLSAVTSFKIRHQPDAKLQLRIGLHRGPCAAGVAGVTMPRYCLFGDTINMASRMESTGKALHIHISSAMDEGLLSLNWGFMTVERGIVEVKGKGLQKTYWLVGKADYTKPLPDTVLALQQKVGRERPPSPTDTDISSGSHHDSTRMYGNAFRRVSIGISFLNSISPEGSAMGSRTNSQLTVRDLNLSCDSFDAVIPDEDQTVNKTSFNPSVTSLLSKGSLSIKNASVAQRSQSMRYISSHHNGTSSKRKDVQRSVSSRHPDSKDRNLQRTDSCNKINPKLQIPKIEIT